MTADSPLHLALASPSFPQELRRAPSPPDDLFLRGRTELLQLRPRVAIVGTRAPTAYGLTQARLFARSLASAGAVIVSGLARGIDEAAHLGALEVGGATIAVLGSGVDRPWPDGDVTQRMIREGLLISEFAPGEGPRRHHFPLRNRLIAGLAQAVVVIEAAQASGSLITARWAVDMGIETYALPGRVDHPMARGCHRLLREGATLVESPAEVVAELGLAAAADVAETHLVDPESASASAREAGEPRGLARAILRALLGETLSLDELIERVGGGGAETLSMLAELELLGAVVRGPGGLYRSGARS